MRTVLRLRSSAAGSGFLSSAAAAPFGAAAVRAAISRPHREVRIRRRIGCSFQKRSKEGSWAQLADTLILAARGKLDKSVRNEKRRACRARLAASLGRAL